MAKSKAKDVELSSTFRCLQRRCQKKRAKYKKMVENLQGQLKHLQERLKCEEALNSKYFDCLEQQGLLCGICMEDIVQDENLACCSNRLCQGCEQSIKHKHKHCPFCRASMVSPDQQKAADQRPDASAESPGSRFAAAIDALMRRSSTSRSPYDAADEEDDSMDFDSQGYDSQDYDSSEEHAGNEQDTSVLLAAAAEAAMAATRGPSGTCGLCNTNWLMSSLATSADLPDLLLCRTCWRNIPDLANKPFVPAARPSSTAASMLFRTAADPTEPAAAAARQAAAPRRIPAAAAAAPNHSRSSIAAVGVPGSSAGLGITPAVAAAALAGTSAQRQPAAIGGTSKSGTSGGNSSKQVAAASPGRISNKKSPSSAAKAADSSSKKKKHKRLNSNALAVAAKQTKRTASGGKRNASTAAAAVEGLGRKQKSTKQQKQRHLASM